MGHTKILFAEHRVSTAFDFQQNTHEASTLVAFHQKKCQVLGLWASLEKAQEGAREVPLVETTDDYSLPVITTLDALEEAMATLKQLFPAILERM